MNQIQLINRSRNLVRDLTNAFFREIDVVNYINEAIERVGQVIPELEAMPVLTAHQDEVQLMPKMYQHLLAVYASARLCTQDERHYQAGTFMNEFEVKLAELYDKITNGDIDIIDPITGDVIYNRKPFGHVVNEYFETKSGVVRPYRDYKFTDLDWEE